MKIKFFRDGIKLPQKSHLPDAGLDIFMPDAFDIQPLETVTKPLGFGVSIPEGYVGICIPRSSIAAKGLICQTSAIDPDYSGELHAIITNCSNTVQHVDVGQRLISLICLPVMNPFLQVVDELPNSERNNKGLGSTGK